MPLPKGIYADPAVRRAWIEERQPIIAEFYRLVAAGLTTRKAAKEIGYTKTGIHQMRASLESLEGRTTGRAKSADIDLGLALLSLANPPGPDRQALTVREIAAWCGCSHAAIQSIERRALRKLHRRLEILLREQVITGDFADGEPTPRLAVAA